MKTQKPQLFLIPFAGGNCYSFNFLLPHLEKYEVIPLELPGRGRRIKEQLLNEFDQAAEDIYRQIINLQTSPVFLIYGHSLGTGLSLRVTNMLEKIKKQPAGLILTGNPGPGVNKKKQLYLLEQAAFIEEIKKLGGLPEELTRNNDFINFIEPVFRADFELAERNELDNEKPVNVPIYAIMGDLEKTACHITNWKRFTTADFQSEILSGDHFFINKHPDRISFILQQCLENARALQYQ